VLARITDNVSDYTSLHLAVLDNKSELRVLQGRLDEADDLLRQAMQLASQSPGLKNSWQHLAATESRVRLLHLRGDVEQATGLALAAERDADRRSDDLLRLSYRLLRASILLDSGQVDHAGPVLEDLARHRDRLSRSQDLELDRMLGAYFGHQDARTLAHDHVLRAIRLQEHFSNAIARVYLNRTAAAVGLDGAGPHAASTPPSRAPTRVPQESPVDLVSLRAAEHLFRLASLPELLGREVLSVLLRAGCVERAAIDIDDVPPGGPDDEPPGGQDDFIALGAFLGRRYRIRARLAPGLAALETFVTIRSLVERAVRLNHFAQQEAARSALWRFEPVSADGAPLVVAASMQQVLLRIHHLASSNVPVLLTGETGTGKEVFARELHRASGAKGSFVPFNCTAVPADMVDAHLFGHRRGAFTGATDNLPGVVRSASGGTLFLDEIGELGLGLQPKLLRLLDRSEVHPLGEPRPITVRVRLAAATNANLEALMAAGRFREDLYYRLNVGRVHIPPLRERREEIPPLAEHFLEACAREASRPRLTLNDEALEALLLFRWPGNVRQLASEMRRLVAFCPPGSVVGPADLSPDIRAGRREPEPGPAAGDAIHVGLDQPLDAAVEQVERAVLQHALAAEGGHLERAARRLAISRKGLFLKRRRLGLDP
jgi:DNA-binding NtrC family response regulator